MDKESVRKAARNERQQLDTETRRVKSKLIMDRLLSLGDEYFGKTVFIFAAFDNEPETRGLMEHFIRTGRGVCVPLMSGSSMKAISIKDIATLSNGTFGIEEPEKGDEVFPSEIDSAIVPGLAFDLKLNRVGFGKGYYDVFLKNNTIKKIALAYEFQIYDLLPATDQDVKMDLIITEDRIISL